LDKIEKQIKDELDHYRSVSKTGKKMIENVIQKTKQKKSITLRRTIHADARALLFSFHLISPALRSKWFIATP
jgi:hypothetical protein